MKICFFWKQKMQKPIQGSAPRRWVRAGCLKGIFPFISLITLFFSLASPSDTATPTSQITQQRLTHISHLPKNKPPSLLFLSTLHHCFNHPSFLKVTLTPSEVVSQSWWVLQEFSTTTSSKNLCIDVSFLEQFIVKVISILKQLS